MRIALCFKENLMRDALERLLSNDGNFEVVASAAKASTAISAAKVHDARVLVAVVEGMDEEDMERLKAVREDATFQILLIAESTEEVEKLGLPYDKIVPRSATRQKLFRATNDLASRELRPRYVIRERPPIYGMVTVLTPREHEISLKVAEGLSNRDIAEDLNLAEQTVKNLVSVVMRKMSCRNRVQVALKLSKAKTPETAAR